MEPEEWTKQEEQLELEAALMGYTCLPYGPSLTAWPHMPAPPPDYMLHQVRWVARTVYGSPAFALAGRTALAVQCTAPPLHGQYSVGRTVYAPPAFAPTPNYMLHWLPRT